MPKKEKVLEIKWHDNDITSLYIPKATKNKLDEIKLVQEEPSYKVIERMISFCHANFKAFNAFQSNGK